MKKNLLLTIWKWFWPIVIALIMSLIVVLLAGTIRDALQSPLDVISELLVCVFGLLGIVLWLGWALPKFPFEKGELR